MELSVRADKDYALNKEKVTFVVEGPSDAALEVSLHVASLGSANFQLEVDARKLFLVEGKASFNGRFLFSEVDMTKCMVSVRVKGGGCQGQSQPIMLCTHQIILVDVNCHNAKQGAFVDVACSLFNYVSNDTAKKHLCCSLIDDHGAVVDAQLSGPLVTDSDGSCNFSVYVVKAGGFRVHVTGDWLRDAELFTAIPATSRRLHVTNGIPPTTIIPALKNRLPDKTVTAKNLNTLGWAPIPKDGLLQCVCCRAVRSRASNDQITHRPNCTLYQQLKDAAILEKDSSSAVFPLSNFLRAQG